MQRTLIKGSWEYLFVFKFITSQIGEQFEEWFTDKTLKVDKGHADIERGHSINHTEGCCKSGKKIETQRCSMEFGGIWFDVKTVKVTYDPRVGLMVVQGRSKMRVSSKQQEQKQL